MAAGLTNQEAAAELGMQPSTLSKYVVSIGLKLSVSSRPAFPRTSCCSVHSPPDRRSMRSPRPRTSPCPW
ncbi:hypothetical protein ACF09H_21725 [Streptomyces sp. NPDC014983]|uniref:hypothetical protein n=1 Tax=Streptomyces sp. NPDC014983 TaxID=3364933 RepID=UPI0036F645EA